MKMKLAVLTLIVLTGMGFAQSAENNGSRVAGVFVAANYAYGQGRVPAFTVVGGGSTAGATYAVQLNAGGIALADGRYVVPFTANQSVITIDIGSNAETLSVTTVSGCYKGAPSGSCTITAVFSNGHGNGAQVFSGSAGLQEAINDAHNMGGGTVVVDQQWVTFGGTNAMLTAAVPYPDVTILDTRVGATQYWNITPGTTTVLATPAALTSQAACDATHQFCSDPTVAGSASWGGTIYCGVTYVDINGNESLTSTTANFTSVASKAIDIASPAASTGAVGWKPYCSVSGGSYALAYSIPLVTQPTAVGVAPVSNGVCTLTTVETVTPACAVANTTYNQSASIVGKSALFNGGAQITGYPVVTSMLAPNLDSASSQSLNPSNGGLTIYKYAPGSKVGLKGVQPMFMAFPVSTAAQSTVGQVIGSIPLEPGFMNYVGRTIRVCGIFAKTSTVADTISNLQLWWDAEGSNVTAGTAVQLSNIQITATLTAAANFSFCQDLTTTVAAATATGCTIVPGNGWMTEAQTSAGSIHFATVNILTAAVGSLNCANIAKIEIVNNHTTGTDGAGVTLISSSVQILN